MSSVLRKAVFAACVLSAISCRRDRDAAPTPPAPIGDDPAAVALVPEHPAPPEVQVIEVIPPPDLPATVPTTQSAEVVEPTTLPATLPTTAEATTQAGTQPATAEVVVSPHEQLAIDMLALVEGITETLKTVQDKTSAEAAVDKINQYAREAELLKVRGEQLGPAEPEVLQAFMTEHGGRLMRLMIESQAQVERVRKNAELNEVLGKALDRLQVYDIQQGR